MLCRLALAAASFASAYEFRVVEVDKAPIISSGNAAGSGRCTAATLCYNSAFAPATAGSAAGLLLRMRNMTIAEGPREGKRPPVGSSMGPSVLGWSVRPNEF